ncbi:nuclear transport factor 2 family protein [Rhodococcus sp. 05-2256-B2]|uniref:nuclear transport factor 2 family protein n=1 Tax=Nocardiaceae TaxID=85025 RepID=UPI00068A3ECE|nr:MULTISPECIES: nuclear transport factor 2 family protein [Rhodococcus]OZD87649.1 nuclear transport factor 2 family protein [Rhodococcus sp. 05-2256-B4]OZD89914.1 nuclear transport factor 2 family protein [Rhodococcus sp. 05-2256-B2]OZD92232.1 nuclear transport factor 2 family protein [Rhodococcus sp. 05-2256-B3]OZD98937.1 nuclear transport factor 2 family protein [Rhodococcus sp. 05-2256-B1]
MNLDELSDLAEINGVLFRYCRGLDRMDKELTRSCWHTDGTDDHAPLFVGTADDFLEWLWPVHAGMELTRHMVTNVVVDLRGDRAGTECYWSLTFRTATDAGSVDTQSGGRYVDMFERRDGVWAITHRRSIREWSRTDAVLEPTDPAKGQRLIEAHSPGAEVTSPARDRSDYSYTALRTTH